MAIFIAVTLMLSSFADLKRLYWQAGVENKPTVFLFVDTQVVEESFLEDLNNVLSSGEVPNLYKPDEFEEVRGNSWKWQMPQSNTKPLIPSVNWSV